MKKVFYKKIIPSIFIICFLSFSSLGFLANNAYGQAATAAPTPAPTPSPSSSAQPTVQVDQNYPSAAPQSSNPAFNLNTGADQAAAQQYSVGNTNLDSGDAIDQEANNLNNISAIDNAADSGGADASNGNTSGATVAQPAANSQAAGATQTTTTNTSGSATGAGLNAVGCSAGQLLANLVLSGVNAAINSATDQAQKATSVNTNNPVSDPKVAAQTAANTGTFTIGGLQTGVSWDSIAYCVVNTMLDYLTQATIQWINSGFNGNPAFVNNPGQFFSDIADQQAGSFIQALVGKTTGLNACQPIRISVGTNLAHQYNNRTGGLSCSLSSILNTQSGYNHFLSGQNFSFNDWYSVTQNPQNNRYGLELIANDALNANITSQQNTLNLQLNWNKGFLSFQHCTNNSPGASASSSCTVQTPGSVIFGQLDNTLSQGKNRLALADKFDQVVSALVNALIQKGINSLQQSNQ